MTVSKLIKLLQAIERKGHGRATICVEKDTLWDGNGTFELCDVSKVVHEITPMSDDDGFTRLTKRGQEVTRNSVVLIGANGRKVVLSVAKMNQESPHDPT